MHVATEKDTTLVVVAHPDDEILGFGGTGASLVQQGGKVQPIVMCGMVDARARRPSDAELLADIEAANARLGFCSPVLGPFPNLQMNNVPHVELVKFIEHQIQTFQPTRIVTHFPSDLNDDHCVVARACAVAVRLPQRCDVVSPIQTFAYMEVQSSTEWALPGNVRQFEPNAFVEIGSMLEAKFEALSCYRGVTRPFPHPRSYEAIKGLASFRGSQAGLNYAEAFQIVFKMGL